MLPETAHWSVVRLYETSSHVTKRFEYLCYQCFINSGFWVQGLKLNVYRNDRGHGGEMKERLWRYDFINRKAGGKTFLWCPVPFDTQTPSTKISIIQIILGSFGTLSLIEVDDTVADYLVLYLRIRGWFLYDKHAVLTRQVAVSANLILQLKWLSIHVCIVF